MVVVRMVRVRNMPVDETADIPVQCPMWVRNWLRRYDEGGLEGLRDLPRCGRLRRIPRNVMDDMVANVTGIRITHVDLQQYIWEQIIYCNRAIYTTSQNRSACRLAGDPNR